MADVTTFTSTSTSSSTSTNRVRVREICGICRRHIQPYDNARRLTETDSNKYHVLQLCTVNIGTRCHYKCIKNPAGHAKGLSGGIDLGQLRDRRQVIAMMMNDRKEELERMEEQMKQIQQRQQQQQQIQQEMEQEAEELIVTGQQQHSVSTSTSTSTVTTEIGRIHESIYFDLPPNLVTKYDLLNSFHTAWQRSHPAVQLTSTATAVTATSSISTTSDRINMLPSRNPATIRTFIRKAIAAVLTSCNRDKYTKLHHIMTAKTYSSIHAASRSNCVNVNGMYLSVREVTDTSLEPVWPSYSAAAEVCMSQTPLNRAGMISAAVTSMSTSFVTSQELHRFTLHDTSDHSPAYVRSVHPAATRHMKRYAVAAIAAYQQTDLSPDDTFHMPSIGTDEVLNATLRQSIVQFARHLQEQYHRETPLQRDELLWEHVFREQPDGFSYLRPQIYATAGWGVTMPHDEIFGSSAANYMTRNSLGCAIWVAVSMNDLKSVMTRTEIDSMIRVQQNEKLFDVGNLLDKLIESNVRLEYVIQQPGQLVVSPSATGAMHIVITYGTLVEKLTWNIAFTVHGAADSIRQWQQSTPYSIHATDGNSTMANAAVLPLLSMQQLGYDLGLHRDVQRLAAMCASLPSNYTVLRYDTVTTRYKPTFLTDYGYCRKCLWFCDWLYLRHDEPHRRRYLCVHCYYMSHHE